ncbi:lipid-A-disaccharide synthase [Hydrogenophaga pseudoflava]|uniref:Lipid-A-disaccharide synthase n=1 Tax=Hydrogenophaga pseudoflava TaxID=47421 RepID=A0A4V1ABI7_HYDPS|nr:lipid-A-disaccharide synthase [Hydrogenophaga pseudoflava]QBM28103.1 Lipid-A-disaccharide synthase [Hydrogenophaga pseudoflava]
MNASRRVALVAGETSGDLLAGLLLKGLKGRWPDLSAVGIGGAAMAKQGFEAWWSSDKLAVRGYVEVLRHYREIAGIRTQLRERLLQERPDAFIGVDAPDFNLDLESSLRSAGVKTVHFICPSIWAWRPERVEKIRRSADHVLCIFPFEPELLARHEIAATYVGHPIASVIPLVPDRLAARRALGIEGEGPVVAILPGSRRSEVQYLARRFFDAAVLMRSRRPGLRFVVPAVPALREVIEAHSRDAGLQDVLIVQGRSHEVLAACDVTLIASGTATLEAALFKRPMVIAYNMHWLSWIIMRRKQLQPWVGLPNILSSDFVVPELLQDAATPAALAEATLAWLDSPQRVAALEERFTQLHHLLQRDTARLATDAIEKVLAG